MIKMMEIKENGNELTLFQGFELTDSFTCVMVKRIKGEFEGKKVNARRDFHDGGMASWHSTKVDVDGKFFSRCRESEIIWQKLIKLFDWRTVKEEDYEKVKGEKREVERVINEENEKKRKIFLQEEEERKRRQRIVEEAKKKEAKKTDEQLFNEIFRQ